MPKKYNGFPTKKEIINALLKEDKSDKGYNKLILIIEHKKLSKQLGIIKGEVIHNGKIILKGKMTCIPIKEPDSFDWDKLKDNQSYYKGYTLDYKGETISSMIKQGLTKSIKEGKIPFIPKFG